MEPNDVDRLMMEAFAQGPANAVLRQRVLERSTQALISTRIRRLWYGRAVAACIVTILTVAAFFVGRHYPGTHGQGSQVLARADIVAVPKDLVTWLEAARFFRGLGMADREARAYQQANRLVPQDGGRGFARRDGTSGSRLGELLAAADAQGSEYEQVKPMGSRQGGNRIMAQVLGGMDHDE